MEFLATWRWWALFVAVSVSFLAYQLGRRGDHRWAGRLQAVGGLASVVFWGLAFLSSSWQGALVLFVATFPATVAGLLLVMVLARRRRGRGDGPG